MEKLFITLSFYVNITMIRILSNFAKNYVLLENKKKYYV